jgi:hypothetical protein
LHHSLDQTELPDILNGNPMSLIAADESISIGNPNPEQELTIMDSYRGTLTTLSGFLISMAFSGENVLYEDEKRKSTVRQGAERHINSIVSELLIPEKLKRVKTGFLSNIRIEAVGKDEITIGALKAATGSSRNKRIVVDDVLFRAAILVTSAAVSPRSSAHPRYAAFVSVAWATDGPAIQCGSKWFTTGELKRQNDRFRPKN